LAYAKLLPSIISSLVVVICHASAFAQISSTVWLTIRDDAGGHDSLVFGSHQFATYCIDTALGEGPTPLVPPGGLIAVFQSIPSRNNCFGLQGIIRKDLRDFSSLTKKDTFYIDFANLDSIAQVPDVKTTIRWPDSEYLSQRCDSMFLSDRVGGAVIPGRIDMFAQDSVVITGAYDPNGTNPTRPIVKLKIFRYGTHQPYVDAVPKDKGQMPTSFALHQNYPNPFNPTTSISFSIRQRAHVYLQIFNPIGQLIATLVDQDKYPGTYTATWDAASKPSGLYFYRITAGEFVQTKKATLIR
jgi:type IX secretion system substrate protein